MDHEYTKQQEIRVREESKKNYKDLFKVLETFLEDLFENPDSYITQDELMQERALDLLNFAFSGYGMTLEAAVKKIREQDLTDLTPDELSERIMILEVIDNLCRFGIAEEYQVLSKIRDEVPNFEEFEEFEGEAESIFETYNSRYAAVEDGDVYFAMGVAAAWAAYSNEEIITYHTQGDERVRESHQALDGVSYTKSEFPRELIPPIDFACRCFLSGSLDRNLLQNKPSDVDSLISTAVNPIFSPSPWFGGKIFGSAHPYFAVAGTELYLLNGVLKRLKERIGLNENSYT